MSTEKLFKQIDQSKSDPTLLHQAFSDLEEFLATKLIENIKDSTKTELSWLFDQCGHYEILLANEACQTVVRLTLRGIISVNDSITALITSATTAKHCGILVNAIVELVLQGSYTGNTGKKQPFIALLDIAPDAWPYVLHHTSHLLSYSYGLIWEGTKLFYLYSLCVAPLQLRTALWSQLYGELCKTKKSEILELLLEALVWQNQDADDIEGAFFKVNSIKQLCDYAITAQDKDLAEAIAIMLSSVMLELNSCHSFGLQPYFDSLEALTRSFDLYIDPIIMILSDLMLECIPSYYKVVLNFCLQQAAKTCNKYAWSTLKFSALSIFSYDSELEGSVINICEARPRINRRCDLSSNKYHHHLVRFSTTIQETLEVLAVTEDTARFACYMESLPNSKSKSETSSLIFLFDCAVFWETSCISSLERAVSFVTSNKKFAQPLLTLLLKKLTTPCGGKTKTEIFYRLPCLTVEKACVPRILQILETISVCPQLAPLQITVLAELWKVEDRAYPYLEKVLFTDRLKSDELLLAKASAVSTICNLRPEKYGSGILSVVSELLNISLCTSNPNYTTVARLSLGALISLCRTEIVDLKSVWDLLSPKLLQENRAFLIIETCRLLALVPSVRDDSEEYKEFIHQTISILFRISTTTSDSQVANAALKSLSEFQKADFHLRNMPEICREDVKIPAKYIPSVKTEAPLKAEDIMDYIPGYSWLKLMDCYSRDVIQDGLCTLLSRLVKEEVESLPKWVYKKAASDAIRKHEPINYNSTLKEDSILAAFINYIQRICDINSENRLRLELVLKILEGPFTKPLPPVDWSALLGFAQQHDLEPQFLHIAFEQAVDSYSAQSITEGILTHDPLKRCQALAAANHLGTISKVVPLKTLQHFLFRLFSDLPEDVDAILKGLQRSFDIGTPIPSELKALAAEALQNIYPQLPDEPSCIAVFAACHTIFSGPHQSFGEQIQKPEVAVRICLSAAVNLKGKLATDYLYKGMQLTANIECLDPALVDELIAAVKNKELTSDFVLQFMSYIQLISMRPATNDRHVATLLRILCLLLGTLSDYLVPSSCLDNPELLKNSPSMLHHFPLYTARLFSQPKWKSARRTMQDWIMAMAENLIVAIEDRQRILDALPLLGGVDKGAFLKAISVRWK